MNKRIRNAGVVLIVLFVLLFANLNYLQVFHARALYTNPYDSRYLIDQNNVPVFWNGEAAWSLTTQATNAQVDLYLANRQQKRVNAAHSWPGPNRLIVENGACKAAKNASTTTIPGARTTIFQAMVRLIFRASACSTRRSVIG